MVRRWWWLAALALVLAVAAVVFWGVRAPSVLAVAAQMQPLQRTLQFSARVASRSRVDLGATITGRVQAVLVREGDSVQAGQTVLQLEETELQAALAQAVAGEQQAAARLRGLRSSGRSGVQAGVAQAESVLVAAQADAQRTRELVASGFLSPARRDDSQRAVAVAQAQLDAARAQAQAVGEQGSDLAQAQAQLTLAGAATQAARARLAQTRISAPTAAQVLVRAVEPGQIVQPGRALLTLSLQGPLQLVALVDERYLQQLQPGQTAQVRADAFPDQAFGARVLSISPLVDAQRGAVEVKLEVTDADLAADAALRQRLREDMTLSVDVSTARRDQALVVPLSALRPAGAMPADGADGADGAAGTPATAAIPANDPGRATLWLAPHGRVQARTVRTGLRNLEAVEVLQGLAAGEAVLVGPAPAPGSRVRVTLVPAPTGNQGGASAAGRRDGDAGAAMSNAMGR